MRALMIALVLFGYWLVLSGHYTPWLIAWGAISAVAVVAWSTRMRIADGEGFPLELVPRGLLYWPWLAKEIVLAALNVTRIILSPRLPISPTLCRVDAGERSAVGITTYANSITLTPGTISVEVSERERCIWVHAITREAAAGLANGEMDRRVTRFEGQAA